VDRGLFDVLRELRRRLATEGQKAPYLIFGDATLRELARVRPSTPEKMRLIYGVGETKLRDYGETFLKAIRDYCRDQGLEMDRAGSSPRLVEEPRKLLPRANPQRDQAFELFRKGVGLDAVVKQTGRARGTVAEYLADYIREARPKSLKPWVPELVYQLVAQAARRVGMERLKPIYLELGEQVSYDDIRLVLTHLTALGAPEGAH
jgi:ATP-dependent DNA helicase RecQ